MYFNEYEVSLDVKPTGVSGTYTSLFRVNRGADSAVPGDRLPVIFFRTNRKELYICTAIGTNKNHCFSDRYVFPLSVFTNIKIQQQRFLNDSYQYSIKVNGVVKLQVINTHPITLYNAKVYLGDPWYNPAKAQIKNLIVKSEPTGIVYAAF